MNVEGKVAVVTGASRGVGRATAIELARLGCRIVLNYRQSADAAEKATEEVRSQGVAAMAFAADVSDDDACREMAKAAAGEFGQIDILVNNAGTTRFIAHSDLEAVSSEDWRHIMDVNVLGPFQCTRALLPYLKAASTAEVVNVASVAGLNTPGSSIPYGASKAALINMTVNLARALGPNIRVNAVAPGFIEGQWLRDGLGEHYETVKTAVEGKSALQRVNQPEDIAAAIVSLITGSDLVTGQTLVVDGGYTIGPRAS
ncbi:MAG TPA: glucose 1-dehydrogenase [Planctomycetes bacterium]|nr:glucose 1-dehydrogenase [Planctomycetaceae bacterium]HIM29396.1 glucose 1-dehydrogenase [Planctomycetota bacterium]